MEKTWAAGLTEATKAQDSIEGQYLVALGQFILCSIRTVLHIKQWWQLNMHLQLSDCQQTAPALLDKIEALAHLEMENAEAARPAVQLDSRLGWEPSMEYVCDEWHLDWKLRQMESALREIEQYRQIVQNAYATTTSDKTEASV